MNNSNPNGPDPSNLYMEVPEGTRVEEYLNNLTERVASICEFDKRLGTLLIRRNQIGDKTIYKLRVRDNGSGESELMASPNPDRIEAYLRGLEDAGLDLIDAKAGPVESK